HPEWAANNSRRIAILSVTSCLNWAVKQGYVPANPLRRRLEIPQGESRGEAVCLEASVFRALLSVCRRECQREMLIGLHQSGVRPEELCGVTAADFLPDKGVGIVRGKTGERPVGPTQQLTELCRPRLGPAGGVAVPAEPVGLAGAT